ncbi:IS5 family transposase [Chryseobacterium sp. C-39]|uniref:IS5 family transposase n=1 Tax=Chryseobacterium muglaense TaxID=2893752 RepID=A0A9Q3UR57_9FLAO|nr:IS5 family transposase [Chryseobacterium muglaense]MCC9033035.1 IS5 family transposase [Chryseobacterium muglaense]MCC9033634.1 IS5 family transposase [Chryseobacterium muglaense]MCC9033785.1 IS5 family transposase [Chryseobacterium muglaense]MCC9034021.1 IS5 family transposase [Chryseobacterium muglaense]MCC9036813.1 IS5 family transposase [Chryseobacterium muglaense]
MLGKIKPDLQQNLFKTRLTELINMEHPLVKLANEISWDEMEAEFEKLFSQGGRPSIAIRKIAGMLLLKEMFKESDETVVERWIENAYWQYFTGEDFFQTQQPFDPSNFVHFRKRIGEKGLEFLLGQSVSLHPKAKTEDEVQIDTTVQEKNITFPTDSKLAKKVIDNCVKIAEKEGVIQRQSYKRVSKQLLRDAYFGHHPRRQKKAKMARKKLRTIGKRVLRELERKLPSTILKDYEEVFRIYLKALTQERNTKDKIYSLHEPQVACIAKGKSGKAYEFGTKVAVVRGRKTGVISSIKRFSGNPHDSKTLEESLAQSERVRKSVGGTRPKKVSTDRGFRGIKLVEGTVILLPTKKEKTKYEQQVARLRFRARAAIEPCISHLKRNHSLGLNFLKGVAGDINNALLAGIGYNLKMRLNQIKEQIILWLEILLRTFLCKYNFQNEKRAF